jgi:hypothetical protein
MNGTECIEIGWLGDYGWSIIEDDGVILVLFGCNIFDIWFIDVFFLYPNNEGLLLFLFVYSGAL